MHKTVLRSLLVSLLIPWLFVGVLATSGGSDNDFWASVGLAFIIATPVYLLVGIVLVIIEASRRVGQGVLLAALGLLVLGFSICSTQTFSVH